MELTQLRYFKALAETGTLSKTAEKLYISPPALSSSISRLERELGTTLFDRGKTMSLNERGQVFLEYITQSLEALDNAQKALDEMNDLHHAHLTVGVASTAIWHDLFVEFLREHPEVSLDQQLVTLQDMSNERILNTYDFIIAAPEDLSTESLHSVCLYNDDRPVLMVSESHPLANVGSVAFGDVRDEGFIAPSKGSSSRRYFDDFCSVAGVQPRIVVECSLQMRQAFVAEGRGIGLTTAHAMRLAAKSGVCFLNITNPVYSRSQALYWHAKRYQTVAARAFRKFAVKYFESGSNMMI